ncbi:MAG: AzlC family ABC transporter permease, partial [Candidatus Weimeria sp.]
KAFPVTIPVMAGYIFLGITYGILMITNGFPVWLPVLTAAIIYTGSMEFLMVEILSSSFAPLSAFFTAIMVGARHLFYGLSMLKKYRGTGKAKFYLIYTCSDETFALNYNAAPEEEGLNRTRFYTIVSLLDQCYWVIGSLIGAVCGSFITFNTKGLDFVMTAMFLSIFADQWLKDSDQIKINGGCLKKHLPEITGVAASVLCLLVFGAERFIIPSMILMLALLLILAPYIEGKNKND